LRIAVNVRDALSWFRVLQLLDGVGPVHARRLTEGLLADRPSLADLPDRWRDADVPLPARQPGQCLADTLAASVGLSAAAQVDSLEQALAPVFRTASPNGDTRLVDLEQLVGAAAGAATLERFVSELVLDPPLSSADFAGPPGLDEDYLVLST